MEQDSIQESLNKVTYVSLLMDQFALNTEIAAFSKICSGVGARYKTQKSSLPETS